MRISREDAERLMGIHPPANLNPPAKNPATAAPDPGVLEFLREVHGVVMDMTKALDTLSVNLAMFPMLWWQIAKDSHVWHAPELPHGARACSRCDFTEGPDPVYRFCKGYFTHAPPKAPTSDTAGPVR